tara:strand:+ start:74 stop:727 length:654 start_codon:yes stop_codon:yes gene_type:complete
MESFIKKLANENIDEEVHNQFTRFGKGDYKRRFLISFNKTKKIKIKASFEFANNFVDFVKELKDLRFSGNILSKNPIEGKEGRKKAGGFVYELNEEKIEGFENAYYYLLDVKDPEVILKIKKKLPKPGKSAEKIDDKFCTLELDLKYWDKVKETFFSDIPDVKKASIEHELIIDSIEIPKDEQDPVKMREKAIRKGKIIKKIIFKDSEDETEFSFSA